MALRTRAAVPAVAVVLALLAAGTATTARTAPRAPAPATDAVVALHDHDHVEDHALGQRPVLVGAGGLRLLGRAGDYSWLVPKARWDACQRIEVAVNARALRTDARGRRAFVREVRWAARQVRRASGLRLKVVGTTTAVPQPDAGNPAGVDVVVAWARPGQSRWLTDRRLLGYGGARASGGRLSDGFVVLNASLDHRYPARRYRGDRRAWQRRITVLHELGHAVGAGHARGKGEIMYPQLAGKAYRFGRGDRTIMRKLGRDRSACS